MNSEHPTIDNRQAETRQSWGRFSIRTLFLLILVLAVLAVWLSRPTQIARRYVTALNSADYESANDLCIGEPTFPGRIDHSFFAANATLMPITLQELWSGKRRIVISVDYGDGNGIAGYGVNCTATHRGIIVDPMMMP